MTNIQRAPQHGGLIRVAFDGGSNVSALLPFAAVAVNIDNWSPYWYKLNPVEEYIPPFQHGVNVSLPLITRYEFVCQAPPGIQQAIIIPTTGIPGNTNPVIAVFSSFGTNNDAGNSALEASTNLPQPFTSFSGLTILDFDLTLYDGMYLFISNTFQQILEIQYETNFTGGTIFYRRVMYADQQYIITIPKISKSVRIAFRADPNHITTIGGGISTRPFIGNLPFHVELLTTSATGLTPQDSRTVTGETTVSFTLSGVDNAMLSIAPNGGAGVTVSSFYWVKVFASNYASLATEQLLYSKVFMNSDVGFGPNRLLLPLSGLLSRNIDRITVFLRPSDGAVNLPNASTILAMHHNTSEALDASNYDTPIPYTVRNTSAPPNGVWTILQTLPIGGVLRQFQLTIVTPGAAGTNVQIAVGTGATQLIFLGFASASVINTYTLIFSPILLDNGLNTLWVFTGAVGAVFGWAISLGE